MDVVLFHMLFVVQIMNIVVLKDIPVMYQQGHVRDMIKSQIFCQTNPPHKY